MATASFRMNRVALLPVLLLTVCVVPLAFAATWTLVFLLVPVLAATCVLRVGVDVGDDGVTVRSLAGSRSVPWNEDVGARVGGTLERVEPDRAGEMEDVLSGPESAGRRNCRANVVDRVVGRADHHHGGLPGRCSGVSGVEELRRRKMTAHALPGGSSSSRGQNAVSAPLEKHGERRGDPSRRDDGDGGRAGGLR